MNGKDLEGASMPSGIEVDEAAAYFGVIESSDMVHTLMAMEHSQALEQFFSILSDIVLLPGDFDFEAASERIQCEGGEIYYLVTGHLGLMSLPDQLSNYLGLPDSAGSLSGNTPAISIDDQNKLATLADPMRIIKLLAIASTTGSEGEVTRYHNAIKALFADPAGNMTTLLAVADELDAAMDVAGHALPLPSLASGEAGTVAIAPLPASSSVALPQSTVETIPLPGAEVEGNVSLPPTLEPSTSQNLVELPTIPKTPEPEPSLDTSNQKLVAKAEEDAFSGAFDMGLGKDEPTAEPVHVPEPVPEPVHVPEPVPVPEPEFVSAAEHFIAADVDGSRELSVEELAVATGTSLEEAETLHKEADTDGDGVVSLSEFISSPAAEKTQSLPRPVAPVRKPLSQPAPAAQPAPAVQPVPAVQPTPQPQEDWNQQQPTQPQQQPQQDWNQQQPQQQGWNQQQPQQQGWNQQQPVQNIQPTIRSGVLCRSCGIGLDPYWRFCPICGMQNAVH